MGVPTVNAQCAEPQAECAELQVTCLDMHVLHWSLSDPINAAEVPTPAAVPVDVCRFDLQHRLSYNCLHACTSMTRG